MWLTQGYTVRVVPTAVPGRSLLSLRRMVMLCAEDTSEGLRMGFDVGLWKRPKSRRPPRSRDGRSFGLTSGVTGGSHRGVYEAMIFGYKEGCSASSTDNLMPFILKQLPRAKEDCLICHQNFPPKIPR